MQSEDYIYHRKEDIKQWLKLKPEHDNPVEVKNLYSIIKKICLKKYVLIYFKIKYI